MPIAGNGIVTLPDQDMTDPVICFAAEDHRPNRVLLEHHVVPDRRRIAIFLIFDDAIDAGRAGRRISNTTTGADITVARRGEGVHTTNASG